MRLIAIELPDSVSDEDYARYLNAIGFTVWAWNIEDSMIVSDSLGDWSGVSDFDEPWVNDPRPVVQAYKASSRRTPRRPRQKARSK